MEINKKIFFQNLRLTQIFCEQRIKEENKSPAKILRTLNLNYEEKSAFKFEWNKKYELELVSWNFEILDNDFRIVKELFEQQQNQKEQEIITDEGKNYKGRIFVSEFHSTVIDGASEIESKGLIDIYDLPPIDTWFYMVKINDIIHLFAWIPEKFEKEINDAIKVNLLDILSWFKNWNMYDLPSTKKKSRLEFFLKTKKWT